MWHFHIVSFFLFIYKRPIPTEIITSELQELREVLVTMGNDVHLLDKWYATDFNCVPPESILLPIDTHLVHFLNKRVPKLQARDSGIWWGTLPKLQLMLRKASNTLYVNGKMDHTQMHNYRMAVTEREVINGCLSITKDLKDHVIIYTRIINNINLQLQIKCSTAKLFNSPVDATSRIQQCQCSRVRTKVLHRPNNQNL